MSVHMTRKSSNRKKNYNYIYKANNNDILHDPLKRQFHDF